MPIPQISDFNKICRMCLKEDGTLINIFYSDAAEIITLITSIVLDEGDSLPESICIPCMDKSTEFYKFKQLCESNNSTLQAILSNSVDIDYDYTSDYNTLNEEQAVKDDHDEDTQKIPRKIQNFKNEMLGQFEDRVENQLEQQLFDNSVAVENVESELLTPNNSESERIKPKVVDINISLKTRPSRKIEIKRSYKDLIPLETYNNVKLYNAVVNEGTQCKVDKNTEVVFQETVGEDDILANVEDVYSEGVEEELIEFKDDINSEDVSQDKTENDWCKYCNTQFVNVEAHMEVYHPPDGSHYCHVCSKLTSSVYKTEKQLYAHLKYHRQPPKFQCDECPKWFKYKHQKIVHSRLHTGERPAACEICKKTFRDPRYLLVHRKSHTGEKPHKCAICQKGFSHKFILKVHMKTHSMQREYMCNKCGKTFIYAHNLKIHLRKHTGEKPYSCDLCLTAFISASVLKAHMLTHSDQRRFECKECGKRFKRTGDLNVHMRSHTGEKPYACTMCSNRYKMSSHLTEHMKTHSGEKNFLCEMCSKSFYNNKSLQVHKNTHTGEKTYHCPDCEKSFVHNASLCAHRRRVHKQNKQT